MPTAAKLFAAVVFAALGFLCSHIYIPYLPDGTQTRLLRESCAGLGAICGWIVMGPLTGKGYSAAIGSGVRTSVTVAFWVVLLFSIKRMIKRSMDMIYDGPMQAVLGVFDEMMDYVRLMGTPELIGAMIVGGALCGIIAEWAGRRWP